MSSKKLMFVQNDNCGIKEICNVTKDMKILKEDAYCDINTGDEIELFDFLLENNPIFSPLQRFII